MSNLGREQLQTMGLNVTARDPTMDARTVHSVNVNNKKVRVEYGQQTRFIKNAQYVSEHAFRQEEKQLIRQIERLQRDKESIHHIAGHGSSHRHHPEQQEESNRMQTYAVRDDKHQPMYVTVTGRAKKDPSKISVHNVHTTHEPHHDSSHHSPVHQPVGYGHTVKEWAKEMGIEQKGKKSSFHSRNVGTDRRPSHSYMGAHRDSSTHLSSHHSKHNSYLRQDSSSHQVIPQRRQPDHQHQDRKSSISNISKHNRRPSDQSVTESTNTNEQRRRSSVRGFQMGTKTAAKADDKLETAGDTVETHGHPKMKSEPLLAADKHGIKIKDKGKNRRNVQDQRKSPTKSTAEQNDRLSKSLHHVKTKQGSRDDDTTEPHHPPVEGGRHRRGSIMPSKTDGRNKSKLHQPGTMPNSGHHLQLSHDTLEEIHSMIERGQGLPSSLGTLSRKQQQRLLALQMQSQPTHHAEPTDFNAFEILQSRYLRLSDSNVKTLIEICNDEGIEVGIHPHMDIEDVGRIVFADEEDKPQEENDK
ncbi:uncharacterized protein [Antedon mediterranea]|uniref:uncharacterized protein n=1 Tax=Antedon mediterranea TaxID=105859 RepID=UPI003AF44470